MLSDDELATLATDLESDRVERKSSLSGDAKERIGQAICGFSNDLPDHGQPGVVFVGLDDEAIPTELPVTDKLLLELAQFREGNILPLPVMIVTKTRIDGRDVAVIVVQPSPDPPVRYYGQVWIRVGPRRAIATRDEERILIEKRQSQDLTFDRRGVRGATIADLNLDFFRSSYLPSAVTSEVIEENVRSSDEQLAALHLRAHSGEPNHAAILLLGRDPRSWLSGAYVQFVRYDGSDLGSPILDQKELGGTMSDLIQRMDDLLAANIRVATDVENGSIEQRRPDYPVAALQQLLRNAVLHRTYETNAPVYWYWFTDRIEIHSPGGLYGRVTEENFGQPGATDYRNPTVAEGLKVLGFVQRFGMGLELARRRCTENGNPVPEFSFSPSAVLATVRKTA